MSLTICNVHFSQQPQQTVYISKGLLKELQISLQHPLKLRLGHETIKAKIKTISRAGKHLYLSSSVRQSIRVPSTGTINLIHRGNNLVQMGPLVGILTDSLRSNERPPFSSKSNFVKQVIQTGSKKTYTFGFTPSDINWSDKTVNGYFLNSQGSWTRKKVAFPDVIYNRLPNRKAESGAVIKAIREKFVKLGIPIFNWSFLNKALVYQLLEGDPEALMHIPESVTNPSAEKMKEMLDNYSFIYFKPGTGSLGYGIYRITYLPRKGYVARYRSNGQNQLTKFQTFDKLYRFLKLKHGSSFNGYVAQQGIRLIEIDKCPIDFRFHMHKDGQNNWRVVGIGAKKAGRGSVTTHMKSGGTLMTPYQALSQSFGNRTEQVLENAKAISVMLTNAIERNYPHRIGELGLDIGIDQNENVWMFEANAKPGRSIFKHPALVSEGKKSLNYILEHCLYLSEFQGGEIS